MAYSKSLTVLTVISSIFALQACSEGITSVDEALANLSNQTSSEATDPPEISIGAANPTGTGTTIPVTPSVVSNYIVNNISILPGSSSPSSPDEDLEPGLAPDTDTPPETDPEEVTDAPPPPPETDSEIVTDTPPETDSEIVTDLEPETEGKEVVGVNYTPVLEAPAEGEFVPYGSTIEFVWSIPVALFGVVTGFDITIADASEEVVSYRNNLVTISSCNDDGVCTYVVDSADVSIPEGNNIWSVSSTGENVSFNIAEASFTLDNDPEVQNAGSLQLLTPAADYTADSSSVDFAWEDLSNSNAAYDLHVYSDAERTEKVTGTNGVIFDTYYIGKATSHTFTDDPSDGEKRYGKIIQFEDETYKVATGQEILFEYTAHKKKKVLVSTDADFLAIKAIADAEWAKASGWYTNTNMKSSDGYHAATVMMGGAQMYKTTEDTSYLDQGIRIAQNYIDSGVDRNGDGYLDWYANYDGYGDNGIIINHYHPEWRSAMGVADVLIEMHRTGYTNGKASRLADWREFLRVNVWNKWKPETGQKSDIPVSYLNTSSASSVGRLAIIAMALDITDPNPGSNEYYTYLNSTSSAYGKMFGTYIKLISEGNWQFPLYTTGSSLDRRLDTQHSNDPIYAALRGKQLGYDFVGKIDEFLEAYKKHLDHNWFPTSAGFNGYSNGSGGINDWHNSSSHGHSLGAALSPELKERWVDMFLNHKPTFSFWSDTGKNPHRAVWLAGGLLYALKAGEL